MEGSFIKIILFPQTLYSYVTVSCEGPSPGGGEEGEEGAGAEHQVEADHGPAGNQRCLLQQLWRSTALKKHQSWGFQGESGPC